MIVLCQKGHNWVVSASLVVTGIPIHQHMPVPPEAHLNKLARL